MGYSSSYGGASFRCSHYLTLPCVVQCPISMLTDKTSVLLVTDVSSRRWCFRTRGGCCSPRWPVCAAPSCGEAKLRLSTPPASLPRIMTRHIMHGTIHHATGLRLALIPLRTPSPWHPFSLLSPSAASMPPPVLRPSARSLRTAAFQRSPGSTSSCWQHRPASTEPSRSSTSLRLRVTGEAAGKVPVSPGSSGWTLLLLRSGLLR